MDATPTNIRTVNPIKIRPVTAIDVSNIVRLLLEWHSTSMIQYPPPVENDVLRWVAGVLDIGYIGAAERAGRIIGTIGIEPRQFQWNKATWFLGDAFFYVNPNYRRSGVATALLHAAKLYAAARRAPLVLAILTGDQPEKLERYYSIQGGIYAGGIMTFGLAPQEKTDELPVRLERRQHDNGSAAAS